MFSDIERKIIFKVKEKIEARFADFKRKPYYNPELPWDKVYLSGGAIASLLQLEEPNDFDFYFETLDAMMQFQSHLAKCELFVKDIDLKYKEAFGTNGKMITAKAITMDDNNSFITMIAADPKTIKASFDYLHCTPHFKDGKLFISEKQFDAIVNKKLIVNNESMVKEYRREKFLKRGYKDATTRNPIFLATN
jgi:hypothetical protein